MSEPVHPTITEILEQVIRLYDTTLWKIQSSHPGVKNMPRLVTVYCLRFLRGMPLKEIARVIRANGKNAVAQLLFRTKRIIRKDKTAQEIIKQLKKKSTALPIIPGVPALQAVPAKKKT